MRSGDSWSDRSVWRWASARERDLRRARRESRRARSLDLILAASTPVVLVVAWQLAASSGAINAKIFTPPLDILRTARDLIVNGTLGSDLGITVARLGAGYAIGAVLGGASDSPSRWCGHLPQRSLRSLPPCTSSHRLPSCPSCS